MIDRSLSYKDIFQLVASKLVPLLQVFQAPVLIWSLINMLSFLLEKNVEQEQPDAVIQCFKSLDILRLLQNKPESYVDEAIIDMLKNLLC